MKEKQTQIQKKTKTEKNKEGGRAEPIVKG